MSADNKELFNVCDLTQAVHREISDGIATIALIGMSVKKACCNKDLAETNVKKADKSDNIESLTTKTAQLPDESAQLKEEVVARFSGLSKLVRSD